MALASAVLNILRAGLVAVAGAPFLGSAAATEYPTRPVTIIVGAGPGSSIDIGIRFYAEALGRIVSQRFIVENRSGGAGLIALQTVASAPPDGYTLGVALSAIFNIMPVVQKLPSDALDTVTPITLAYRFPIYMVVPAATKATTARQFFEEARKSGKSLNFGSGGTNSTSHLLGLLLSKETGVPMQHVPYTSPSQYLVDLEQGRIDFQFMPYSTAKPYIDSGKLKFLAVSSAERTAKFPDVPTLGELGFRGAELSSWYGIIAPKGTPDVIVGKISALFQQASRDPDLLRKMEIEGTEMITSSPSEFETFIRADKAKHKDVLEQLEIIGRE